MRRGDTSEVDDVLTLTVTFVGVLPTVTGLGEIEQLAPEGAPVQTKLTDWEKPSLGASARVKDAVDPGATVTEPDEPEATAIEKSCPVPVRTTVCVAPDFPSLLSVTVSVPADAPAVAGEKLTFTVQEALIAKVVPQLLVSLKLARDHSQSSLVSCERQRRARAAQSYRLRSGSRAYCLSGKIQLRWGKDRSRDVNCFPAEGDRLRRTRRIVDQSNYTRVIPGHHGRKE